MKIPNIKLNNGTHTPQVGLGLWHMRARAEAEKAVTAALELGYRHFDTAQIYGNEVYLGNALKKSSVARKDLFITTKIWNENQWWDDLIPSFERSLEALQTDYVDLLLLHFPVTETRGPAWRKMEEVFASGMAKAVGVSNYTIRHLEELLKATSLVPAVNQVELHVYLQQPELLEYCRSKDIIVEAYSPLAHGNGLDNEVLAEIAKKHDKTPAQIMLRWTVEVGAVTLPKSVHKDRITENMDLFDFKLDEDDMAKLQKLDSNYRTAWDPTNTP